MRIIRTIKDRPGRLVEQLVEYTFDRSEVRVKIEVLFLNIQDQRVFRLEKAQRPIALIAFRHEMLALRITVCI